jgi:uncharacterized membrane protein YdbT with pleckstrin-like domain
MGYVDENLITGEAVKYRATLHWLSLLRSILGTAALTAAGIAFVYTSSVRPDLAVLMWFGIACFVLAVAVAIVAKVKKDTSEFAVTNKRVILKTGLVQRRTSEMFLAKIETVGVDQSLLGRALDFGTISLVGTGGTTEPFAGISRPLEFRRQVQEQMALVIEGRH